MKNLRIFAMGGWVAMCLSLASGQAIPNNVTYRDFFGTAIRFTRPVFFAPLPGRDSAYVVVEQPGNLQAVTRQGGAWVKSLFVNITVQGGTSGGDEQGLLGVAFHPNYLQNRRYYLYAVRNLTGAKNVVCERTADASLILDAGTPERIVLSVVDPAGNHNGGTIGFGTDGYLYVGLGDGGGGGDTYGNSQLRTSLLAKILRLDVDGADAYPTDANRNYAIPSTNPFVGNTAYAPEIWAWGLRNPFRWSFHPNGNGELWVGDVGQNVIEEVSLVPRGGNMGWNIMEGNQCYTGGCTPPGGLTGAVTTYARSLGNCITGGTHFVGDPAFGFHNVYIFGDYGSGRMWGLRAPGGTVTQAMTQIGTVAGVTSIVNDSRGRVFTTSLNDGMVRILESPDMRPNPTAIRSGQGLHPIPRADLLNGYRYTLRTLDGRTVPWGKSSGLFLVTEKNGAGTRLVPVIW